MVVGSVHVHGGHGEVQQVVVGAAGEGGGGEGGGGVGADLVAQRLATAAMIA